MHEPFNVIEEESFDMSLFESQEGASFYLRHYGLFSKGIKKQKQINQKALSEYLKSNHVAISEQPGEFLNDFLIEISGNLDLARSVAKNLDSLKLVKGWLDCEDSQIKSFAFLEEVYGDLCLKNSQVRSLKSLKKVLGFLDCEKSNQIDFSSLEYVGKEINLEESKVKELPKLKKCDGTIWISKGKKKFWNDYFVATGRPDMTKIVVEGSK